MENTVCMTCENCALSRVASVCFFLFFKFIHFKIPPSPSSSPNKTTAPYKMEISVIQLSNTIFHTHTYICICVRMGLVLCVTAKMLGDKGNLN